MQAIDWQAANAEVVEHLRALIQLDTRNPPGNEIRAAAYLRDVFAREGITAEIVGPTPDRASLVARLAGNGTQRPLLLMSHTDVVAVEPQAWTYPPFAATVADGAIWGRGALDMKQMVAMELQTMLLLKRAGLPLARDVIFLAAADEEVGGHQGAGWVAQHHPALIEAEYALNEGGGAGSEVNGVVYYGIQIAEKGTARFRLRTRGTPGHGSQPHDDSAVVKLVRLVERMMRTPLPVHLTPAFERYLEAIAAAQPPELAAQLRAVLDPAQTAAAIDALPLPENFRRGLRAQVRNTLTPTILRAGEQINVIPSHAEAQFDARILPGWTNEQFLAELHAHLGDDAAEIELIEPTLPLDAPTGGPLWDAIVDVLRERDPTGVPIPTLLTGGTDAKHIATLGTTVYGFAPGLHPTDWSGIHGHDEHIHIASLEWGTRTLYEVVARFCGIAEV